MRNGPELDGLKAEARGFEDQLPFWKEREEAFVTDRKSEKQAFEMFTLIKHISDAVSLPPSPLRLHCILHF